MNEKVKAEYFPWLIGRESASATPKYKIVARAMNLSDDSIVMIHKAGALYVENHYIREIVKNDEITSGMDDKELNLLKWVVLSEDIDPLDEVKKEINNA